MRVIHAFNGTIDSLEHETSTSRAHVDPCVTFTLLRVSVPGLGAAPEEPLRLGLHPHLAERRAPGVLGKTEGSRGEE